MKRSLLSLRGRVLNWSLVLSLSVVAGCGGGGDGGAASPPSSIPAATSSLRFQWDPVAASDLAGYRIYRSTTPGTYGSAVATLTPSTTTYQMTNLTKGTTYYFVLTAFDANGNESVFSSELSQTIP